MGGRAMGEFSSPEVEAVHGFVVAVGLGSGRQCVYLVSAELNKHRRAVRWTARAYGTFMKSMF